MLDPELKTLLSPLRTGQNSYDIESGICFFEGSGFNASPKLLLPQRLQRVRIHETAHAVTEAFTSIGRLLQFLKSFPTFDIIGALSTGDRFRHVIQTNLLEKDRNPLLSNWKELANAEYEHLGEIQGVFQNWSCCFISFLLLFHGRYHPKVGQDEFVRLTTALCWAISRLQQESYVENEMDDAQFERDFLQATFKSGHFLGQENVLHHSTTTAAIFESVAIVSECMTCDVENGAEIFDVIRLRELRTTYYLRPIDMLLKAIGCETNIGNIRNNSALLLAALNVSLDPPIPPWNNVAKSYSFSQIYPPARLESIISSFHLFHRALDGIGYGSIGYYSFLSHIRSSVDPSFEDGIELSTHKKFHGLANMQTRPKLENMFLWVEAGELVTLYDMRAFWTQNLLSHAWIRGHRNLVDLFFMDDWHTTLDFQPIVTLRADQNFKPSPGKEKLQIPIRTDFLPSNEILEWFLVYSGIQSIFTDIYLGSRTPKPYFFSDFLGYSEAHWLPQLELRVQGMLEGMFRIENG